MRELVRTYDARSYNELYKRLSVQDTDDIYAEYGPTWKETAEHSIANYCKEIIIEQETMTFEEILRSNHHSRTCQHPADTRLGEEWLDQLIQVNNINKRELLMCLTSVMNKLCTRKNAFVIEGPTTTGKTLFVKLIAENYVYGTVQRSGDHSQFFLMNLLNKTLALMEEPRITQITVNDFKELLGGNPFDIHVKHQKDERLERIPVLITTNNALTYYVLDADGKAILERCFYFKFHVKVGSADLPEPPTRPPTTTTIKPEEQETKPTTITTPTEEAPQPEVIQETLRISAEHKMDAKRQKIDTQEDESYGSNLAVAKHAQSLFGIHYYKTDITVVRKQHLTLAQYKPGETGITQYYVTCLPYQLFEFWTLNKDGNNFRDPLANLVPVYDYIHYNHASIRLSHFVPLQQSLSSTTQQDTPALNTTPYAYVAKDSLGILDSVTAPTAIDKTVLINQQLKLPSNTYWAKESDEGLLGLANVKTFHQGETLHYNFAFDNQMNCLKQKVPRYDANSATYLPIAFGDPVDSGIMWKVKTNDTVTGYQYKIPEKDLPFLFIFLPYIEQVNSSETIARLYAHVLMETQLNFTLWTVPDGAKHLTTNMHTKNQLNQLKHLYTNKSLWHQAYQFNG